MTSTRYTAAKDRQKQVDRCVHPAIPKWASGAKRSDLPLSGTFISRFLGFVGTCTAERALLGAEIQEWPTAIPESHLLKLVQL